MKKFKLTLLLFAIFCSIFSNTSKGQTVFSDDFSTNSSTTWTGSGTIGSSVFSVTRSGADWAGRRNTSPAQLELTNDSGSVTNVAGWVFASTPLSGFSSPFNPKLSLNSNVVTWTFNMRTNRTSALAGFSATTSYGMAVVLVSTSTTPNTSGNGYAVVMGGGTSNAIALISFTNGLQGTRTTIAGFGGAPSALTNYMSVKVVYDPTTNNWQLFGRDDGNSGFADPTTGTLTQIGSTTTNSTYTSTSMAYMGAYWQGSTSASQTSFYDNFKVVVTQSVVAPSVTTTAPTSIGVTSTTFNGNVTADGGASVTDRGFCYKTTSGVTISDNKTSEGGTGTGTFSKSFTTLSAGTQYFYKAYATNSAGTNLSSTEFGFWTYSQEPASYPITFTSSPVSQSEIDLSFNPASTITNATGYLILMKSGSTVTDVPTDGTGYTVSNTIGTSTVAAVISSTSTSTAQITGLTASTTYYFSIIPFGRSTNDSTYNYKTDGTIPSTSNSTYPPNAPTKLVITSLNGGSNIIVNPSTFSITIQAQDKSGTPQNVSVNTDVTLSVASGTGSLGGTITGTINASSNSVTITGITYNVAETNVNLRATVTAGVSLNPATSSAFTVLAATPSDQPTSLSFASVNLTGYEVSFTPASSVPNGYIVLRKQGSSYPTSNPVAGTVYTAGNTIGDGTVAYVGSSTNFTESSLSSGTQYSYYVYSYNGSGATTNYLITSPLQGQQYTMFAEPTTQASNISFSNVSSTGFTINWTNGDGSNHLVLVKAGSPVDAAPTDGNFYSSSTTFGNGTQVGTGNYVVYNYTSNTVNVSGLTEGTAYYVSIFDYNGGSLSGGVQNYLLTSPATGNQTPSTSVYYSKGTGTIDPTNLANWSTSRDGSGSSPASFTTSAVFVIQATHIMIPTSAWALSGSTSVLEIENGGTLQSDYPLTLSATATFKIDDGGTYIHNNTTAASSSIFAGIENFSANSNVEIKSWSSSSTAIPAISGSWGNLKITYSPTGAWNQVGNISSVAGNFTLDNSSTNGFRLTGNSSFTMTVGGNFNVTSGLLNFSNAGAATNTFILNIGGSYNQTGGTFTPNVNSSSSLVINFTGANKTFTQSAGTLTSTQINWNVNSGASLTLNNNLPVATGKTLTVNGTLNCGTNAVTGAGAFTLSSGATLGIGSADGITSSGATGNIQVTGTRTFDPGANYVYNGTSAQVTGNGLPATVNALTISNATGITLSSSTTSSTLNMTSGNIEVGANVLSLGTSVSNLGVFNYTAGQITGTTGGFKRWFAAATVSNVMFPVGTASTNNKINLSYTTAPSAGGTLTASFIFSDPLNYNSGPINDNGYSVDSYSPVGYWQLTAGDGLADGVYDISFDGTGFNTGGTSITNYRQLRVLKRTNSTSPWTVPGTHTNATGGNNTPVIMRTGLTGFSQFGMGGNTTDGNSLNGTLPVQLTSLSASVNVRDISLTWSTASEINNTGFEVQRKDKDGIWKKAGFVKGNGTTNEKSNYSFDDKKLTTGKYNYRLKQIDVNGNYTYFDLSNTVEISTPTKFNLSQNYPNPFNPVTKIDFDLPTDSRVRMVIYDLLGREVKTLISGELKQAGYYTIEINATNLASGTYFCRMIANSQNKDYNFIKRMVVLK